MNIAPFTLYGLIGCPHCQEADTFLRGRGLPTIIVMANDDPVVKEGVLAISRQLVRDEAKVAGKSEEEIAAAVAAVTDEYPVLVSRVTKEVIKGFKKDQYERIVQTIFALNSASTASVFGSQQQPVAEAPKQS